MRTRLLLAVITLVILAGCGANNKYLSTRGRGDAPVGKVNNEPATVIQMPDRFFNVATKCDGFGHRLYVTTQMNGYKSLVVIDDSAC